MTKDEEAEKRIDALIEKLELHLERLVIIDRLINTISSDKELGEAIRKLIK
jgi:hypothetical protein